MFLWAGILSVDSPNLSPCTRKYTSDKILDSNRRSHRLKELPDTDILILGCI
uniref:Uncharacterized protein n=1 Tax=Lepeophtheirus salmonis TaxID=72036 RepID=A0A0K2T2E0_LEPSM